MIPCQCIEQILGPALLPLKNIHSNLSAEQALKTLSQCTYLVKENIYLDGQSQRRQQGWRSLQSTLQLLYDTVFYWRRGSMVKAQSGNVMRDSGKLIRWQKEMMIATCFQSHIKCQTLIWMDLTVGLICCDVPPL